MRGRTAPQRPQAGLPGTAAVAFSSFIFFCGGGIFVVGAPLSGGAAAQAAAVPARVLVPQQGRAAAARDALRGRGLRRRRHGGLVAAALVEPALLRDLRLR